MGNVSGWVPSVLRGLGAPATAANIKFLQAWQQAEGGSASYNPLNTTQPASGAGSYNSVGVRNYTSPQQGIAATIQTLKNGHYGNIVGGLRSGRATPLQLAQAVANSPWGTGSGVLRVLGGSFHPGPVGSPVASGGSQQSLPSSPSPRHGGTMAQILALTMLSNAGNTVRGEQQDPNQLMQLALMRDQLGAAQNQNGPAYNPNGTTPNASPNQHGGWAGKSLDGTAAMIVGGKSPYSNLRFGGNVDWRHVNPRLLKSVNAVAATHGTVVTINSGYRSNSYSQQVGGFAGDPHSKGLAIDASVNGQPIGKVFGPNVWKAYGVRSGDTFSYHGSPDYEHLDLMGG